MMSNKADKQPEKLTRPFHLAARYLALQLYTKRDSVPGMYRNLYKLKFIYNRNISYYYSLSKLAYSQKKWTQELDHIHIAIHLSDGHANNEFQLFKADCLSQIGETTKVIQYLNEYLSETPKDVEI